VLPSSPVRVAIFESRLPMMSCLAAQWPHIKKIGRGYVKTRQ
jgi:hypothetical protein